jgi:hypothetical protein
VIEDEWERKDIVQHRLRVRRQFHWLTGVLDVEETALSLVKPFDVRTLDPELVACSGEHMLRLWGYWRVALSAEGQNWRASSGRFSPFLLLDRTSGALLGILNLADPPENWPAMDRYMGWGSGIRDKAAKKWRFVHRTLYLGRCLPIYDFGPYTGGKLMALAATSREVVALQDWRYSLEFLFFTVRTLHGRGSQYNRLHARGLRYLGSDEKGRGFYMMELRRDAIAHVKEGAALGPVIAPSFTDQVAWWKERWLPGRITHVGTPIVTPDPDCYRVSRRFRDKHFALHRKQADYLVGAKDPA